MCDTWNGQAFIHVEHILMTSKISICYTYIGLLILMKYASGYSHLLEMSNYYVRLVIKGPYLHTFPRVFTCRLHVWNPVSFITSMIKAAFRDFRGPSGSTHPL